MGNHIPIKPCRQGERPRGPVASSSFPHLPAGCRCGGPAKPWLWLRPPTPAGARDGPAARCQLDRLADLIPQPRRHRHRYHGVFAPNHPLRPAVTALAVGNVRKQRDAATIGHAEAGHAAGDCCDSQATPRSHDTSRIAWAKLLARVGEEFPLQCPVCGGDIRLISFITEPGPIRKILTHLGEPLEPPPDGGHHEAARRPDSKRLRADTRKTPLQGERGRSREPLSGPGHPRDAGATRSRAAHQSGNAGGSAIDRTIVGGFGV